MNAQSNILDGWSGTRGGSSGHGTSASFWSQQPQPRSNTSNIGRTSSLPTSFSRGGLQSMAMDYGKTWNPARQQQETPTPGTRAPGINPAHLNPPDDSATYQRTYQQTMDQAIPSSVEEVNAATSPAPQQTGFGGQADYVMTGNPATQQAPAIPPEGWQFMADMLNKWAARGMDLTAYYQEGKGWTVHEPLPDLHPVKNTHFVIGPYA